MSSFNPVGPQGQPGPQGPAGQVHVASTQTGEAGTSAEVVNVGTATNAQLAFTIPRGNVGEIGPMGPIGPKGDPGDIADRAATIVPGDTVALTVAGGDIELQIPSWINSISVASHSATTTASPSPATLVVQDASIDWATIGGFDPTPTEDSSTRAYYFAANTIPQYSQIGWFSESFSAGYYGLQITVTVSGYTPQYTASAAGLVTAPLGPVVTETRMTGTDRIGGSFDLLWGSVTVATSPPTSGDCNMAGGNVTSTGGSMGVTGSAVYVAHQLAGQYRTYSVTRSVTIPTLNVDTGLPDGTYTGTISGYAFAQLPQWLVFSSFATWQQISTSFVNIWMMRQGLLGAPADFLGPTVTTLVPWSQSGSFTVSGGKVQIPGRTVNISQSCPCYARIGPYMFVASPQAFASSGPPTNEQVWNAMAAHTTNYFALFTAKDVSRSVPLYKGYFVSTISLSS